MSDNKHESYGDQEFESEEEFINNDLYRYVLASFSENDKVD
jgi:hypothetical protein